MTKLFNNILGTVGNTPIIKINKLSPEGINMYVKAEGFNPMGSVKTAWLFLPSKLPRPAGNYSPGKLLLKPPVATPVLVWPWSVR